MGTASSTISSLKLSGFRASVSADKKIRILIFLNSDFACPLSVQDDPKGHIMAVPCVPDVPQVFKFFEKIFGKWDMGHMKNHIMAVPHVPKSSKFLNFFFFT